MIQKVGAYIQKMHMIQAKDKVYIALSGGADSVCLFFVLLSYQKRVPFELEAIHVEHGIRGQESKRDQAFVEALCQEYNVRLHTYEVDVPAFAKEHGMGLEEAARYLRYEAFYSATEKGQKIAVAHHMEDHAETVLFQMARGTGLSGMCGLSPVKEQNDRVFIRPLLTCNRKEIEVFLDSLSQEYCKDETNEDIKYSRNRIRHEILPELVRVNDKAIAHIAKMSEDMIEMEDFLNQQLQLALKNTLEVDNDATIYLEHFKYLHPVLQKEVLLTAMEAVCGKRKDLQRSHIDDLMELANMQSGKSVTLPYGMVAVKEFELLRILQGQKEVASLRVEVPKMKTGDSFEVELLDEDQMLLFEIRKFDGDCDKIPRNKYTKWFDYDKIKDSILVRNRREKDYLTLNEAGQQKKLKEYLIEAKIPASKRDQIPLVAIGQEILWVIGGRTSENYRVYKDTEYILVITYNGGNLT